uniref:Uncharacterized protein n=1 Tax=Morchella brunnea TaxID=1174671 RepID=A0A8K1I7U6_9PEZI|nr:hypothetical protein LK370_mgp007 [Morchella brunnea]UBU98471.1 hypothetical protein [Morchella brunnea]
MYIYYYLILKLTNLYLYYTIWSFFKHAACGASQGCATCLSLSASPSPPPPDCILEKACIHNFVRVGTVTCKGKLGRCISMHGWDKERLSPFLDPIPFPWPYSLSVHLKISPRGRAYKKRKRIF